MTSVLNRHFVSKEITRKILKEEIKSKQPDFHILAGGLILQIEFLRMLPQSAFYEVIEILDVLKYCFNNDKRITIKRLSNQTILRLFACLFSEFINLPMYRKEDQEFIIEFRKFFSKADMLKILNADIFLTRFILEHLLIDVGSIGQIDIRLLQIIDEFYQFPKNCM